MSRATLASVTVFLSERVLIVGDDQQTTSFLASSSARWQSRNTDRHHHLRKARHCSQDLALATRGGMRAGFDGRRRRTHHHRPAPDPSSGARRRLLSRIRTRSDQKTLTEARVARLTAVTTIPFSLNDSLPSARASARQCAQVDCRAAPATPSESSNELLN